MTDRLGTSLSEPTADARLALPSYAQERLWFLQRLDPDSAAYNVPLSLWIHGAFALDVLTRALNEIVERHESLRTLFPDRDGRPRQVVLPRLDLEVPLFVVPHVPEAERETLARASAIEQAAAPFDLASGPLIRARVLEFDREHHALLLTMHHIVCDGMSTGIIVGELGQLYDALLRGEPSPLPPVPTTYSEFATSQRERIEHGQLEEHLEYWCRQLSGVQPVQLPMDRPRPPVQTYRGGSCEFFLDAELSAALKQAARAERVTPFMVLLSTFQLLLSHYAGQTDIAVGSPFSMRATHDLQQVVGLFMNTLVFRGNVSGDPTFRELLARTREVALAAYAHRDVPFEKVVAHLPLERDLSRPPVFQTMLVLQKLDSEVALPGGVRFQYIPLDRETAMVDLELSLWEVENGLAGLAIYNRDLFDLPMIEDLVRRFENLLERAVANRDARLSTLTLVDGDERRRLTEEWSGAEGARLEDVTLTQLLDDRAARSPDAIALIFEGGELTYRDLDGRVNELAHRLRRIPLGPDDRVAILLPRGPDLVFAVLATLKSGAAYVPLDVHAPPKRLTFLVEDSGATVVVTERRLAAQVAGARALVICVDDDSPPAAARARASVETRASCRNLAYCIYTSGSTGRPKAVAVEHLSVVAFLRAMRRRPGLSTDDVVAAITSVTFDISALELLLPLTTGATVVLAPEDAAADPRRLIDLLERHSVTVLQATPTAWQLLVDVGWRRLQGLKGLVGGEPLSRPLAQSLLEAGVELWNMYGPTETTIWSTVSRVYNAESAPAIGRPIENTRVYVLDDDFEPVPPGVAGELFIGGTGVARGYLGNPGLTAASFVPDPFGPPGVRLYRTGDRARWRRSRELEFLGRRDQQVKLRGHRIELGEIEAALRSHRDVAHAAVSLREDHGNPELVAYVVPRRRPPAPRDLREWLADRLPQSMVPAWFVVLDELPLSTNGKLDRRALPAPTSTRTEGERVPPEGAVERKLVQIFGEVLNIDGIGATDDFFELGGHSLLATQVTNRAYEELGIDVPVRALFERPTARLLAEHLTSLGSAQGSEDDIAVRRRPAGAPLSFTQERLWFLDRLGHARAYNVPAAVRIAGAIDPGALEQSLRAVVTKHEVMRARFVEHGGRVLQVTGPIPPALLAEVDLSDLASEEREAAARGILARQAQRAFDLRREPGFAATLVRLAPTDHILAVTMSHLVSDGWSVAILFDEIFGFYSAAAEGKPPPARQLPLQYGDFAAWERETLTEERIERHLAHWRTALAGSPESIALPADRPRPVRGRHAGAAVELAVSETQLRRLDALCRRSGATRFMAFLTALFVALWRITGQSDLVVGTVVSGRRRRGLESLIGPFVNFLPLRMRVGGEETLASLLARVREVVLEAFQHEECPFDRVVRAIQPTRVPNRNPIYNVALLLQNFPWSGPHGAGGEVVRAGLFELPTTTSELDLRVVVKEIGDEAVVQLEYDVDLFDHETAAVIAAAFAAALDELAESPGLVVAGEGSPPKRGELDTGAVVVAGTFATEPIAESLRFWLDAMNVPPTLRFTPYGDLIRDLLDPKSALRDSETRFAVLLVRVEDWMRFLPETDADRMLATAAELVEAVRAGWDAGGPPLLVVLCPASAATLGSEIRRPVVTAAERLVVDGLASLGGLAVLTAQEILETYLVETYDDERADATAHVPYKPAFYAALGTAVARRLALEERSPVKAIVVDADGTLWEGACSEDGAAAVVVDDARLELQRLLLRQREAGRLLCLCSKNDEDDVWAVFAARDDIVLRPEHFAATRVNWRPKSENISSLAAELGFALESIVFLDDDPVECDDVRRNCPDVETITLPRDGERLAGMLRHLWPLDIGRVTAEDAARVRFHGDERKRERAREQAPSLEEFLEQLDVRVDIEAPTTAEGLARLSQLTFRTSQFNSSGIRRSTAELAALAREGWDLRAVRVVDRFGDYGVVGLTVSRGEGEALVVDSFMLSCRALRRGVEDAMLDHLRELAKTRGLSSVDIRFAPTERNGPAQEFLDRVGVRCDPNGLVYRLIDVTEASAPTEQREVAAVER